jgi:hypothetical protein
MVSEVSLIRFYYEMFFYFYFQISVADLDGDDKLDIVSIDTSGDVICYNPDGKTVWEVEISGSSTAGCRLYDVNQDNVLDVIIATNVG